MYTVRLAAMLMQSGAKISDDNMQHLREIVPQIHSSPGYASPLNDDGFRDPGKVQFLAALEHYKPGTPPPSCYKCGKIQADIGKKLSVCSRCKVASYCDHDCQKAHWSAHKPSCFYHRNPPMMLNV
ncbi:mynd zinc finger [Diaporthe amygdali]|uniref:mynd zinc finger n=1 Tax=Phomopsis amygdali TaxID=1214568 RepID=UPI0022FF267B|nr:mynd zinc finger [Diaporthe amygdali]KAJ0109441.1 mynd zinc finger [Diaporthe amygdali]